jgi:hypothetical protein
MKFSIGKKREKSPKSKKKKERSGLSLVLILTALFLGGVTFQYIYTSTHIEKYASSIKNDQTRILEIQNTILQLKFYDDRKSKIERNYQIYAGAQEGPVRKEDLAPFPEYGFENFNLKKIEVSKRTGVGMTSENTEFQRIAAAVASLEARYPLLQIARLTMSLPSDVPPMDENPTFLDCMIDIYTPTPQ